VTARPHSTGPAAERQAHPEAAGLQGDACPRWAGQAQWHILDTQFDQGTQFFLTWQAWRNSSNRPARLFYSAIEPDPPSAQALLSAWADCEALRPLAETLATQWRGLLPGTHRWMLDGGAVHLTLHVGRLEAVLPMLDAPLDQVWWRSQGDPPAAADGIRPLLKAVGRLCRHGTMLCATDSASLRNDLNSTGFRFTSEPADSASHTLLARFDPQWPVAPAHRNHRRIHTQRAVVVGGGLAGAACAFSLAQRGWQVEVLDQAERPAAGASGLPAGLIAPHVSPDDALLSRLSRAGVGLTLQRAAALLRTGTDWSPSGVIEHQVQRHRMLPSHPAWETWGPDWSRPANEQELQACGLPSNSQALHHTRAAWIRPTALVQQQLLHPNIRWRGLSHVRSLEHEGHLWTLKDAHGAVLSQSEYVVLAMAWHSRELLATLGLNIPLNPLRGQICWGHMTDLPATARRQLPPWPVNGHGAFMHGIPGPDGQAAWFLGSTFERGTTESVVRSDDRQANMDKLQQLLPTLYPSMQPVSAQAKDWAGVRCTLPDRVPAVGALAPDDAPGLLLCTGLGARGLTLSVLCGELLAAQLHNEPWPLERRLAQALLAQRFWHSQAPHIRKSN